MDQRFASPGETMIVTRKPYGQLAILSFTLLLSVPAFAQSSGGSTLPHVILQNESGTPLAGAIIDIFKGNWNNQPLVTLKSGRDGSFTIGSLSPGEYILSITKAGYESLSQKLLLPLQTSPMLLILKGLTGDQAQEDWKVSTVLRAASEKDIPFRLTDGQAHNDAPSAPRVLKDAKDSASLRNGVVQITTLQPLGNSGYNVWPSPLGTGFSTRFAYVEPVSANTTYVVTGTITTGSDSQYRLKSVLNYQVGGHKLQISAGYDKMGQKKNPAPELNKAASQIMENEILDTIQPIQNINVGIQDYFQIAEPLSLVYGFDLMHTTAGLGTTMVSPKFQLYFNPAEDLAFRFLMNNEVSSHDTLRLAEGEIAPQFAPMQINKFNDKTFVTRFNHLEAGLSCYLSNKTKFEFSSFMDQVTGSGYPFVAILKNPDSATTLIGLPGKMADSTGFRFNLNHSWNKQITSSVLYIYGSGVEMDSPLPEPGMPSAVGTAYNKKFFNIFSTSIDARIDKTGTGITAIYRYSDGLSLTPVDRHSNYYDLPDRSVSVFIRQSIPLLKKTLGQWEAILDIRNILNQGIQVYQTNTGDLILVRNARSLRGGIQFRF